MATNDDIADALVSHSIGLQRLSTATVRKVLALLKRSDARIIELLTRDDLTELSRARQEELLRRLRKVIKSAYVDATGKLQVDLAELAVYEGQYQADLFKRIVPVNIDFIAPAANQVIAAVNSRPFQGKLLKDWFTELEDSAFRLLRNSIRAGVVENRTIGQMVREIRGTAAQGYKDGILEITRRHAETTVRTAVAHTAQTARSYTFQQNSGLIKGEQWTSTLDGRTSAVCRARDGMVYKLGKGPRPPAHPNCRSSMVPILKSASELGLKNAPKSTRASMNGQVPEDMNYDGWLRKQPKAFQDDVLGKRKAELFRSGLKMERFVDRSGAEYTLDELKKREAEIWAMAST